MNLNAQWKNERLNAIDGMIVSDRAYNLIIGAVVLWGLAVNWMVYHYFAIPVLSMSYLTVIILYFIGSLGGMFVVYKSHSAVVSFLGFTVLAAAMGILLTSFLYYYDTDSINQAVRVTAVVTMIMMIAATIYPNFFLSLGRALTTALIACVAAQLIFGMLLRFTLGWLDWVVALIFCGYIGFDWSRAQRYPKTLDNAVDSAADIYVDIVNLFVRILSIMDRNRSSK